MKRIILLVLICTLFSIGTVYADSFWVGSLWNDTTNGFVPNIQNFDWSSSGSGNAQGMGPAGSIPVPGTNFDFRYQSYLFALNEPNGNVVPFLGLNTSFEYTVVAKIPETILSGTNLGGGLSQAIFKTLSGGVFYIYHDSSPNANVVTGMGFDDGVLVASGTIDPDQLSTFTYNANTGTGLGSTILFGKVNYANPAYLNPTPTIVGFRVEGTLNYPPLDSATAAYFKSRLGEGNLSDYTVVANDLAFKVDTSSKFIESFQCCIDLEKKISIDGGLTWQNADNCVIPDTPTVPVPGSAQYQLIVTNCGNTALTNVKINDSTLKISDAPVVNLGPGQQVTLTGTDISQLAEHLVCQSAGQFPNTSTVDAICSDPAQTPVDASDTACLICEAVGGCRMTGGHVKFYDDGTSLTVPGDAETYKVSQVTVKRGNKLQTQDQVTWYTLGGQIGAPAAACLSEPDTAFGNWEHVHHQGTVSWPAGSQQTPSFSWPAGIFSGGFAFHSGTASAPDEAFIKCITCADPGWCVQARCAPFKQIFWEGTGVFHNIDAGTTFPNGCTVQTPGKNKPGTIHYYRAHVGDFGEPAGSNQQQKPADQCGWASAGVSILGGILDGVTVLPWPPDLKFGDKGGQDCSSYPDCDKGTTDTSDDTCGECPDWYEIEIHCDADPDSPIIYKVGNFITHGNHQIHPEVGQQCPY